MKNYNLDFLLAGTGIATQETALPELLDQFGLNWKVSKQPLYLPNGNPSGFNGIVRDDKQICFSTCKDGYEPYQNIELAELVNEAAGSLGLRIDKGGLFKSGALVYLQIETGEVNGLGENRDSVKKYISAINSHDGSTALKWGMSNITISCQNTFWATVRQLANNVKHTASMRTRIDSVINAIQQVQKEEQNLYKTFFKLAEVPAQRSHIESVVKQVLNINDLEGKKDDLSNYEVNRLTELSSSINKEMKQKGQTLWGLFSGVTHYTTHVMPGGSENRAQSKAVGAGAEKDNLVFKSFSELVA